MARIVWKHSLSLFTVCRRADFWSADGVGAQRKHHQWKKTLKVRFERGFFTERL